MDSGCDASDRLCRQGAENPAFTPSVPAYKLVRLFNFAFFGQQPRPACEAARSGLDRLIRCLEFGALEKTAAGSFEVTGSSHTDLCCTMGVVGLGRDVGGDVVTVFLMSEL